jgi:diacylglycerol O-acyltransferase / wax synthase
MDLFMRDSDAFSWYMERDPTLRSTVVAVAWLEESPDWEVLAAKVDQASRLIPLFRQKVLEPPGRLATPRWTVDEEFDLTWHLRRIDAPAPHTAETVVEFARREAMTVFDRSRPLWEFTLIEHLDGERAALVMKIHHSLTDGIGGMQLALLLFDAERVPVSSGPMPDAPIGERLDTSDLIRESIIRDWERVSGFVGAQARSAVPSALHAARHPLTSLGEVLETARSIGRTVAPVREMLSPIMKERGLGRDLDLIDVALDDLKQAAAVAGGTINDGFMAAVTGGLRRYHERHDTMVDGLRVTLPISIRTPKDPMGGNRITLMRFVVPVADRDPASRIAEIHRLCRVARDERSVAFTNSIAGTLNLLPQGVVGSMLKYVDFVASDVPGFAFPVYLGGALLERYVAFGPTIGSPMNVTLLSYNGRCCVGVTIDTAAVPDHEVLVECLREGFEEVLGLAHDPGEVRLPLHEHATAVR